MRNITLGSLLLTFGLLATGCGSDSPTAPAPADPTPVDSGRALDLDGDTAFVQVANSRDVYKFIHETGVFTVEAWIKLDDANDEQMFAIAGNTFTNREYGFFFSFENRAGIGNQQLRFHISTGSNVINSYSNAQVITDSAWHHVAAVGDGEDIDFYVDGVEVGGTGSMNQSLLRPGNATRDLLIGDTYSGGPEVWQFDGEVDEMRIWNVERTDNELTATRDAALGSEYTNTPDRGLMGYWRFDALEDLGVTETGANDVRDLSVRRRHGDVKTGGVLVQSEAF